MKRLSARWTTSAILLQLGCLAVVLLLNWTALGTQVNNNVYDYLFSHVPPPLNPPQSVVLAIDEATFAGAGVGSLRKLYAEALRLVVPAHPAVVAIDSILSDAGDAADNATLTMAMRETPNLVLGCDLLRDGQHWELPLAMFPRAATGHVHAEPDSQDAVNREYPLEKAGGGRRYFALALESARLFWKVPRIVESPDDLQLGDHVIASARRDGRTILIRYRSGVPVLSLAALRTDPVLAARCTGKAVFIGVTALSAARDRVMTPYANGQAISGVEVHAQAFETLTGGETLRPVGASTVALVCVGAASVLTAIFLLLSGWQLTLAAACVVALLIAVPLAAFQMNSVFPAFPILATAWICAVSAGAFEYFVVRRALLRSETEKSRYQQAIHFVTHEMRTPLTAIQGSSELMGRYNLNDDKRRQMAQMINTESKRLARMITTFLSVERLNDGQMELRHETVNAPEMVQQCLDRAAPLADRKNIELKTEFDEPVTIMVDRELMEYAIYNLITNAIKYSPQDTIVTITVSGQQNRVLISVRDQGIGMDAKELRQIFQKFYRTKKAEQSGEAGTGIGLSIVEQIISRHGGKIEVSSAPGAGSCFTVLVPRAVANAGEIAPPVLR